MRPWTRLQDWGTLLAGLYAALSPIWVSTTGEHDAFWALIALGALLAVTAVFSLALPGVVATEWLTVLFGVLLFVAPWCLAASRCRSATGCTGRPFSPSPRRLERGRPTTDRPRSASSTAEPPGHGVASSSWSRPTWAVVRSGASRSSRANSSVATANGIAHQ